MIGEIISIQTYGNSANSGIGTMLTPMYGNYGNCGNYGNIKV